MTAARTRAAAAYRRRGRGRLPHLRKGRLLPVAPWASREKPAAQIVERTSLRPAQIGPVADHDLRRRVAHEGLRQEEGDQVAEVVAPLAAHVRDHDGQRRGPTGAVEALARRGHVGLPQRQPAAGHDRFLFDAQFSNCH